jgi:23S rRNA G2445 N2-methylase RlmL
VPYRFAVQARSYQDFASGRVIRSAPGQAAFPVRLASEMLEQAWALDPPDGGRVLYDPCCGAGHLLTSLGLLHAGRLSTVIGSDVDERALALAAANLRLLEPLGLAEREQQLASLCDRFGKPAHQEALASVRALAAERGDRSLTARCFRADARDEGQIAAGLGTSSPGVVLVDVPYGRLSSWSDTGEGALGRLLGALAVVVRPGAVVALATGKQEKVAHPRFSRARQMRAGLRRITWLVAVDYNADRDRRADDP